MKKYIYSALFLGSRKKLLETIDIATVQSLANAIETEGDSFIRDKYGLLLVDECHHAASYSAYQAINDALSYVKNEKALTVPEHLKSPSPKGYLYPHDFGGWVEQSYSEKPLHFYRNLPIGFEKTLNEWLEKIKSVHR